MILGKSKTHFFSFLILLAVLFVLPFLASFYILHILTHKEYDKGAWKDGCEEL